MRVARSTVCHRLPQQLQVPVQSQGAPCVAAHCNSSFACAVGRIDASTHPTGSCAAAPTSTPPSARSEQRVHSFHGHCRYHGIIIHVHSSMSQIASPSRPPPTPKRQISRAPHPTPLLQIHLRFPACPTRSNSRAPPRLLHPFVYSFSMNSAARPLNKKRRLDR